MTIHPKVFKALSDETRLGIFELIRARCPQGCRLSDEELGHTVSEIAAHFHLTLPTVSHHLKELRNAELIRCAKRGRWVYCTPNQAALDEVWAFARGPASQPSTRDTRAVGEDVLEEA